MEKKVAQKALEVKFAGSAIECGSLAILLGALHMQDVLVMPIERIIQNGPQVFKQVLLHVTARPYAHAPVYYTSFLVLEIEGLAQAVSISYPFRTVGASPEETLALARGVQQGAFDTLKAYLERSGSVSRVLTPARYRLPDEWVWTARCYHPRLVYREGGWQVERGEEVSHG